MSSFSQFLKYVGTATGAFVVTLLMIGLGAVVWIVMSIVERVRAARRGPPVKPYDRVVDVLRKHHSGSAEFIARRAGMPVDEVQSELNTLVQQSLVFEAMPRLSRTTRRPPVYYLVG